MGSVFRVDVIQKHAMLQSYVHCDGRPSDLPFCPHLQHTQAYQSLHAARRNSDVNLSSLHMKNRRNYCSHSDCIAKTFLFYSVNVILTTQCVLRELIAFCQNEFSRKCDLALAFSFSSTFSFPSGHPAAACIFFLVFPSLLSFVQ